MVLYLQNTIISFLKYVCMCVHALKCQQKCVHTIINLCLLSGEEKSTSPVELVSTLTS